MQPAEVEVYQNEEGSLELRVPVQWESVWLNANQMALLFGRDKSVVSRHIRNVFGERELDEAATVANFATVQNEGGRTVSRDIAHYSLDVVISVGYRVKSQQGVRFRQWATSILREHLVKGYTIDRKRLAENADELTKALELVRRSAGSIRHLEEGQGLVDVISRYTGHFSAPAVCRGAAARRRAEPGGSSWPGRGTGGARHVKRQLWPAGSPKCSPWKGGCLSRLSGRCSRARSARCLPSW
jgi:hypothetical protein